MARLTFSNKHYNPVNVMWVTSTGEQLQAVLRIGEIYQQDSKVGDKWRIRDRTNERLIQEIQCYGNARVLIREQGSWLYESSAGRDLNATGESIGRRKRQFALDFSGGTSAVVVPHSTTVDLLKTWTIEAWIFRQNGAIEQTIVEKSDGSDGSGGYSLRVTADDYLVGGFFIGKTFIYAQSRTVIDLVRWVHVAVTFNADLRDIRLYVDGRPVPCHVQIQQPTNTTRNVLQFDGTNDYLAVPVINVSETEYSVCLWFKTERPGTGIYCVDAGKRGAGGRDRDIFLDAQGNLAARLQAEETIVTSGVNCADGVWHHAAHVFGGAVGGQRLYVDGVLRAQGVKSKSDFSTQDGLNIGYSGKAAKPYFEGQIAEVSVWNVALSAEKLGSDFRLRLRGDEAGLLGLWRLDDGFGAKYLDRSTAANHAIIEGTATTTNMTAVSLDAGGYLETAAVTLNPSTMTISFWAKRGVMAGNCCILGHGTSAATGLFVGFRNNRFVLSLADKPITSLASYTDNQWHHFACEFDTNKGSRQLYVDGIPIINDVVTDLGYTGTGVITLGRAPWGEASKGSLAEVVIWEICRGLVGVNQDRDMYPIGTEVGLRAAWTRPVAPDEASVAGLWNAHRSRVYATAKGTLTITPTTRPYGLPDNAPRWNRMSELNLVPQQFTPVASKGSLYIGNGQAGMGFDGMIDSVRIWGTTRKPEEIRSVWHQDLAGKEPGLNAFYMFDEGQDTVTKDRTANANNGALGSNTISRPSWFESALLLMDGLRFDGIDDYLALPTFTTGFDRGMSIEAWIYLESARNAQIIDLGNGAGLGNVERAIRNERARSLGCGGATCGQPGATVRCALRAYGNGGYWQSVCKSGDFGRQGRSEEICFRG